jgi:hypothetical protein
MDRQLEAPSLAARRSRVKGASLDLAAAGGLSAYLEEPVGSQEPGGKGLKVAEVAAWTCLGACRFAGAIAGGAEEPSHRDEGSALID